MELSKFMVHDKPAETLGIQMVVQGDIKTFTNPVTGEEERLPASNGTVLWKLSDKRHCGHFLLAYEKSLT